jgi:hypothetical protein
MVHFGAGFPCFLEELDEFTDWLVNINLHPHVGTILSSFHWDLQIEPLRKLFTWVGKQLDTSL